MFARIGLATMLTASLVFSGALWASGGDEEKAEQTPVVVEQAVSAPQLQSEDEQATTNESPVVVSERAMTTGRDFVVYIMRHAEKEDSELDPELTRDGYRRADGLAQMLGRADIEAIYSTYYRRSVSTALPLARKLSVPVQFYQADAADALLQKVQDEALNALIIGHSNTVPDLLRGMGVAIDDLLAGLSAGAMNGDSSELNEEQYGDLFQVFISDDNEQDVRSTHLIAPLIIDAR